MTGYGNDWAGVTGVEVFGGKGFLDTKFLNVKTIHKARRPALDASGCLSALLHWCVY